MLTLTLLRNTRSRLCTLGMGKKTVKKGMGISTGFLSSAAMDYSGRNWRTGMGFSGLFGGEIDRKQRSQRGWVSDTPLGRLEFSG